MQGAGNDLSDDYVEEELPRGGAGRSRARLLKKAEAHRSSFYIIYHDSAEINFTCPKASLVVFK